MDDKKTLKKQAETYKQSYLRALADYQNFEKRAEKEKEEILKNAAKRVILKVLPVLDTIEQAEVFVKDEGLKNVKKQLVDVFEEEGLEEIEVLGKEFDPHLAEAIEVTDGKKDNVVAEVVRKGYVLNGKVIRPAQVKVTKKTWQKS